MLRPIAQIITDTLRAVGQARVVRGDQAHLVELQGVDILIAVCPTQGWNATPAMLSFLEHIASERRRGLVVACFDTRFRMPRWMTGSAAEVMGKKLREIGVSPLIPSVSFFVSGRRGPLYRGELDRAAAWGRMLLKQLGPARPAVH